MAAKAKKELVIEIGAIPVQDRRVPTKVAPIVANDAFSHLQVCMWFLTQYICLDFDRKALLFDNGYPLHERLAAYWTCLREYGY